MQNSGRVSLRLGRNGGEWGRWWEGEGDWVGNVREEKWREKRRGRGEVRRGIERYERLDKKGELRDNKKRELK
ncbi:hypothetical protein Pmani_011019 [Petrolisthes manimaculis]|uniref:Uncharacterized protein n=1 Tax=Petrolisthes manimaculis TaxID=1843537 RepID=A0AAE1Q0Y1_9EUCA|nr:hypothetical protein Pmani_011019 [Petrolisthes manimaculis]